MKQTSCVYSANGQSILFWGIFYLFIYLFYKYRFRHRLGTEKKKKAIANPNTTHYSDAHTTCEKVSLSLLPKSHQKSSQSTLVLFTPPSPCFCSFCLLFYAIQNSALPISPFKFSLPTLPEICHHLSTEHKKLP